jgi:nitroreductase
MLFKDLVKKRYSCRKMSDRKVEDNLIEQIIDSANSAPTAVNKQPVKIFWMKSNEAKEMVKKATRFTFGAESFLVVGYNKREGWVRNFDNHAFAETDAAIVATHIMLQITELGLATTWVGYFDAPLLKSMCQEMEEYEITAIFPIGYAAEDDKPSPRHFVRKERKDLLEVL